MTTCRVTVLVPPTVRPFELAVYCEIFGVDRTAQGVPAFDFAVVAQRPELPIATLGAMAVVVTGGLDRLTRSDLIAVAPALTPAFDVDPLVREALHGALSHGSTIVSVCSAAFTLAAAGILDGRSATTHWMYTAELARRHPAITVRPDVLYVDEDPVFTSAGTAAGIDLCLHVVRKRFGAAAANAIARGMVVAPHRSASQAQWVHAAVPTPPGADDIDALLSWAITHLHGDLSVAAMARRSFRSERSLTRRFREATGTTPYAWVLEQRIRHAQHLLEERPDLTIDQITRHVGLKSAGVLRQQFTRRVGCSPSASRVHHANTSRREPPAPPPACEPH